MPANAPRSAAASRKRPAPVTPPQDAESADAPEPQAATADASTLDEALAAWSGDAGRSWASFGLNLAAAWLQGARAIREEQRAAAERAEAACLATGQRLQRAGDWQHAAAIQADFLREQVEDNMETALRLAGIARDSALKLANRMAEGWGDAQLTGFNGLSRWAEVQSKLPTSPEVLEAEAEHMAHPFTAGPLMWPAQEAMRQSMTLASSVWNDWLENSQRRMH
jgi:hypothetical protein